VKAAVCALVLVLVLNVPEFWHKAMPWDVWAADQVAQGLLLVSAPYWAMYREAAVMGVLFGIARAMCVGLWPDASDENGSICDAQTGRAFTVGFLGVGLFLLWMRVKHRE